MNNYKTLWDVLPFTKIELPGGMSIELVHSCPETWPSDRSPDYVIASAARASFNNFSANKTDLDDERLIKRLVKDRHTSPIEMASLTFLIRAPKFVTIHLLRHRTFKFNEESQRYHEIKEGYFHPSQDPDRFIRVQDKNNKQSSNTGTSPELLNKFQEMEAKVDEILKLYHEAIELGAAKECARFCLPMSSWSHIVIQCDMNNLMKFLTLRMAKDAQYEIQLVARAMFYLAEAVFPHTMGAFREFMWDPERMSLDDSGFKRLS